MVNPLKAGVTFAALLGGFHLCWAFLVAFGWAQSLLNFVLWMHFIQPVFVIRPFSFAPAAMLIVFTCIVGFVFAFVFAGLWNKLHRYQGLE
jgi:hypothetical protein